MSSIRKLLKTSYSQMNEKLIEPNQLRGFIESNNLESFKHYFEKQNNMHVISSKDEQSKNGNTLLHVAIKLHRNDFVKYLIQNGADVNRKNDKGRAPIHTAAAYGNLDAMNILLANQFIDIHVGDNKEKTALHIAAKFRLTFENQQEKAAKKNKENNLVSYDHIGCMKALLEKGVRINDTDRHKKTVLHQAIYRKDLAVVEFLIDHNADANLWIGTRMDAEYWGTRRLLQRLIELIEGPKGTKAKDKEIYTKIFEMITHKSNISLGTLEYYHSMVRRNDKICRILFEAIKNRKNIETTQPSNDDEVEVVKEDKPSSPSENKADTNPFESPKLQKITNDSKEDEDNNNNTFDQLAKTMITANSMVIEEMKKIMANYQNELRLTQEELHKTQTKLAKTEEKVKVLESEVKTLRHNQIEEPIVLSVNKNGF